MARTAVPALFLIYLFAVFDLGASLRCYQCNSEADHSCRDPFVVGNKQMVDCSTNEAISYNRLYLSNFFRDIINDGVAGSQRACHKIVLQTGTTIRTCLDVNPSDPNHTCRLLENAAQANPSDISKQIKTCRFCSTDACNGAGSITTSLPLAALTALVSYIFYKQ